MTSSNAEKAYNYILDRIYSKDLKMGAPVNELAISEEIGLSRSPVREALRRLEVEGMVDYYPGRGNFVVTLTAGDIDEIFELRKILETAALGMSAPHIDKDTVRRLEDMINDLDPGTSKPEKFYRADKALHDTFVNRCGNRRLADVYRTLMLQIELVRRVSARGADHFAVSKKYHLQILESINAGDTERAVALLGEHLDQVKESTANVVKFMGIN
jgi:DNA-binding GntR family transcriptional regulator